MAVYQKNQELEPVNWGTMSAVTLMLAGKITQIRVRGTCSLIVKNPANAEQSLPDQDSLTAMVTLLLTNAANEGLYSLSSTVENAKDLTEKTAALADAMKQNAESNFTTLGLGIKTIAVEAIEIL